MQLNCKKIFWLKYGLEFIYFNLDGFYLGVILQCYYVVFVVNVGVFVVVNWYFCWGFFLVVDLVDVGFQLVDNLVSVVEVGCYYVGGEVVFGGVGVVNDFCFVGIVED